MLIITKKIFLILAFIRNTIKLFYAMLTSYENNYATYDFHDTILYICYKEGRYIDYHAARRIVNDRLRTQAYKAYPIICDVSNVTEISTEAREYLASYGSTLAKAVALISSTDTLRNMAGYFVTINKPTVPTKIFDNLEAALQFLIKQSKP